MALHYCKRLFTNSKTYDFGDIDLESLDTRDPSLVMKNIDYCVKKRTGPWWKGCCLRPIEQKHILKKVNVKFESGELTAILGSSGKF